MYALYAGLRYMQKEKYIISTDNGNGYKIVGLSKKHKRKKTCKNKKRQNSKKQ